MSGTIEGGIKARDTNIRKYGADFYVRIGQKGGKLGRTGGFHHSKINGLNIHIEAGRKGGKISRRGKALKDFALIYEEKKHWWSK